MHLYPTRSLLALVVLGMLAIAVGCRGGDSSRELILATTTSTQDSGLLEVLIPRFEAESDIHVKVIAVGSGAAMEMGQRGDADVLLVHAPAAEEEFVAAGYGVERARVMYNDFVIVGPPSDPAGVAGAADAAAALAKIAASRSTFMSRGDHSGTHAKEQALWAAAGLDVPRGRSWYQETGQGMGATLTISAEKEGYTLTDRSTWLAAGDQERLPITVEGDPRLFNVYHVIVVNPDRHPKVNAQGARRFRAFLLQQDTLREIGEFGRAQYGQPLFTPDPA
ncbi:MAG: substrate-binding domain-containing protein [Chloroflexi bacterium]|nr:substrate-binding domain-containing protein [Chloroflexota bacterium]MDA1004343.1 substrate-binding domain-containing protein [Chloroflexota bacterium]